ncbi:hypothetical protein [Halochromatium salexigens]|uniref:hypothetical protein n=1 Tax=Halochromatium salexigens TaxID=49447 RepID=UPI001F5C2EC3|nr:hypothetical protein [Halochromatium salexigens]
MTEHDCNAIEIAPGVHWIGALDPGLRSFDMILRTANGTTYNAYAVRGRDGVAIIDTVKAEFADGFFTRLEQVARLEETCARYAQADRTTAADADRSGTWPEAP